MVKDNGYACTYEVGNTCTDSNGVIHDSDECTKGESWETCKARLCPYVEPGDNPENDIKYCSYKNNIYTSEQCRDGESWEICKERLCPGIESERVICATHEGKIIKYSTCLKEGLLAKSCINKYCSGNALVTHYLCAGSEEHTVNECTDNESIESCISRVCTPDTPGTNVGKKYCIKESDSYYVCDQQYYVDPNSGKKGSCEKMNSREEAISNADINYNCCPSCTILCVNSCVFDINQLATKALVGFRTVTPSSLNPNNRQLGYNWNIENKNTLVAQKAMNTINEIRARATVGIDTNDVASTEKSTDYTLKVKLTPSMAHYIRQYNNSVKDKGSYNNDTLECADYTIEDSYNNKKDCENAGYTWKDNTCRMTNILCYSTFIDDLIEKYKDENLIEAPNRDTVKDKAFIKYTNPSLPI